MHIPDGYLSPSTCAVMYVGAAPFWWVALRRVGRLLHTRLVPLLALFAAFSFVVMMFNLPLPGGTTGHAVGMGVAAIVLGPWGAMLSISVALLIQALFFQDGGVTAYGANCFNMAILGSLASYGVYRALAGCAPLTAPRRAVAAALAGYAGINVAALAAAIELGLQPELFHDATGAPLYAPYPLAVALPAMMIVHLTIGGLAEMIVTGGVVAYLQKADPALLKLTAPEAREAGWEEVAGRGGWRATRPLWGALGLLMVMTPLGLLAAGTAWGEWGAADFKDPAARQDMARASGHHAPPAQAPRGLEKLSSLWTAPLPDYAPPFLKSAPFGYIMSAMTGTGLIILVFLLLGRTAAILTTNEHG